jgi:hypothetical protein
MMQRREFLAASTAAAIGLAANRTATAQDRPAQDQAGHGDESSGRQLIELRVYHFASPQKRQAFEQFLAGAWVPAVSRAGAKPVGVFSLAAKDNPELKVQPDPNDLFVVIPHPNAQSFLELNARLVADESFLQAGQAVIMAPKSDPAYTRYETSLLRAFASVPTVAAPVKGPGRVAQLRIYESHSSERGAKKIQMFEEGGEIAIFKKVGLNPVFFGQTVAGAKMPSLTYMVAFEDEKAQKAGWAAFGADPGWKKLSGDATYKDTVSNITNLVLRPVEGSQI